VLASLDPFLAPYLSSVDRLWSRIKIKIHCFDAPARVSVPCGGRLRYPWRNWTYLEPREGWAARRAFYANRILIESFMATLRQTLAEKFLAKLLEDKAIDAEKVEQLRAILASGKKPKAEEFVKVFICPTLLMAVATLNVAPGGKVNSVIVPPSTTSRMLLRDQFSARLAPPPVQHY
jgi:hypothetical protein